MRRIEIEDAEIMRIAVQQEIQRSPDARYDHRLHGLLLLCGGMSCYGVAALLGHSVRTVEYWAKRFEENGFAGLEEIPRPGRPPALDAKGIHTINRHLRRNPRTFGYEQNLWDGKLLSHHLENKLGVHLGVRQCQRLFRELGFRRRKPRPVIAQADPELQRTYKKTASAGPTKRRGPLVRG